MQQAIGRARLPEPEDEVQEVLVPRGPDMFLTPDEETQARLEASQTALEGARQVGMNLASLRALSRLVLESKLGVFRRALTGDPMAELGPLCVVLKPDAARDRVRARPRRPFTGKMEWLEARSTCSSPLQLEWLDVVAVLDVPV